MANRIYKTKIELNDEKIYDGVISFLGGVSFGIEYGLENVLYSLDKNKEGVARLNPNKYTIELTDKVEKWIIDSINNMKKQKIKGEEIL